MSKEKRQRVYRRLRKYKVACGCHNCGYNKHGIALDFAHEDPMQKSYHITKHGPIGSGISRMIGRLTFGKNKELNRERRRDLFNELRKCKILCKNCHVVETQNNKEWKNSFKTNQERKMMRENTVRETPSNLEEFFS